MDGLASIIFERGFDLVFAFGSAIRLTLGVWCQSKMLAASLTSECGFDLVFAFGCAINKQLVFGAKVQWAAGEVVSAALASASFSRTLFL